LQNRIWLFHPGRTITRLAFLRAKDKRIETDDLLRKVSLSRKQVDSASLRTWELRAAMSLARLWRDQGKVQQARELLAPVYGWFTEGFDTRDLREAKALLDELHA
jgi:predicted ATPase